VEKLMAPWRSDYFEGVGYVESTDPTYNMGFVIAKIGGAHAKAHAELIAAGVNYYLRAAGLLKREK